MLVEDRVRFHLTYCSNIHPGETWDEVRRNLEAYLPAVRERLGVEGPFGVGLRLSAQAAAALDDARELARFTAFLRDGGYYVFTINGFSYGAFGGRRVKDDVYLPDWLHDERVRYTNRLASILAAILPDDPAIDGSVSTVPGAFKARVRTREDALAMAANILRHVAHLVGLRERTGRVITLALEPEPCCFVETVDETLAFFGDVLFNPSVVDELTGPWPRPVSVDDARRHLGVCFDACHMAVEFEDMAAAIAELGAARVPIRKFQISAALKLRFREGDGQAQQTLAPFAEEVYLHQVVERGVAGIVRYTDLPEALAVEARKALGAQKEWRVHFHVPIFLSRMKDFETTQDELAALLDLIRRETPSAYLEVETYTWDVLPAEYRTTDAATAIARELAWVRERLRS